jgi:hypothetical protein
LQVEIGLSGILAELNCGGLIPHRQVVGAMQLLCEEVMPRFRLIGRAADRFNQAKRECRC